MKKLESGSDMGVLKVHEWEKKHLKLLFCELMVGFYFKIYSTILYFSLFKEWEGV